MTTKVRGKNGGDSGGRVESAHEKSSGRKNTKEEIVIGAIELFSKKGYTETSMRDLAIEAKIQPGSIYNHFSSKQEILEHILEAYAKYIDGSAYLPQAVEALKEGFTIEKLMRCFVLDFPPEWTDRLKKMLHIILHEQYRNDTVRQYVAEHMIIWNYKYVKSIFDMLIASDFIEPVDSDAVAKHHISEVYFWSNAALLGVAEATPFIAENGLMDALRFFYESVLRAKK